MSKATHKSCVWAKFMFEIVLQVYIWRELFKYLEEILSKNLKHWVKNNIARAPPLFRI